MAPQPYGLHFVNASSYTSISFRLPSPVSPPRSPPPSKNMLIKVRTLTGKEIELDIEPDYKVSQIKEKVEEKEGIPPVQQRLIYGGKQMSDDKTAKDYELAPGVTLHLVLALRGGLDL
ncbi:hypothetical protein BUE80_DR001223 [Diplocarpon rosae]|nr:hypothetical protein BUE80_DR001223 [Diplocarpon rosae]